MSSTKKILYEVLCPSPILTVPEPIYDDKSDAKSVADAPQLKKKNVKHHCQLPIMLAAFLIPEDIILSHSLKEVFQNAEELMNEIGYNQGCLN